MIDFMQNFPWFIASILLSVGFSLGAWYLVTKRASNRDRLIVAMALIVLFFVYNPISWVPAGYVVGLGDGI